MSHAWPAAAIEALPESERAVLGVELVNDLLARLHELQPAAGVLDERLVVPAEFLTAISRRRPDGAFPRVELPLTPLPDTTMLTSPDISVRALQRRFSGWVGVGG